MMKFPKMKHGILCCIIVFLPLAVPFVLDGYENEVFAYLGVPSNDLTRIIYLAVVFAPTVLYFVKYFFSIFAVPVQIAGFYGEKRDRMFYTATQNGNTAVDIEKAVLTRAEGYGKDVLSESRIGENLICARYKRAGSVLNGYLCDKLFLVYRVGYLDEKVFSKIEREAKPFIARYYSATKKETKKHERKRFKIYYSSNLVVFIICDEMRPTMPQIIRSAATNGNSNVFLPCAVDVSSGKYYFNGNTISDSDERKAYHALRKLVFNGKSPYKGNNNFVSYPDSDEIKEQSLWEYMHEFNSLFKDSNKEDKKIFKSLKNGSVVLRNDFMYCKLNKKSVSFTVGRSNENPSELILLDEEIWDSGRKISKKQRAELEAMINSYCARKNLTYRFTDDMNEVLK